MAELYGKRLKLLRVTRGLTQRQLGALVAVEHSRIAQLERATGARPTLELSRALDAALGTDGLLADLQPHVYRETFPDWSRAWLEKQARATEIRTYVGHTAPGLLQTPEYARATLRVGRTLRTAAQLEERVAARLARQERLLAPNPPALWVVLDESVLRRPVGGPEVMRGQLAHLLTVGTRPNIHIQVLPFSHGEHSAMGGSLSLCTLPDGAELAYTEGADMGQLVEDPTDVKSYGISYDHLRAEALPSSMSLDLIQSCMEGNSARVPAQPQRRRVAQVQLQQPGGWGLRRGGPRRPRRRPGP
ncbi:helix-turn-helix transcriptional regulator [Streptomyces sp. MNP-20]|uniref:helix-turn-helix domain-containing protein n=1 Tax=Streptomyces sp. MNP-20 TaxID=2721165 RepID=UPI0020A6AAD4|nr:helix-turn-helix transcriptional regulator [Streptomyces sp. MNP-20]